jgi:hypothetical protein
MKAYCTSVLCLAIALVSPVNAADAPAKYLMPLLGWGQFPTLLTTPKKKAELKITKDQEPDLVEAMKKWRAGLVRLDVKAGKTINFQENEKANVDAMYEYLAGKLKPEQILRMKQLMRQESGMDIFEHKEIRDALNLKAAEIPKLRKIHDQLLKEISGGGNGKYTKEEVGKRFGALLKGVPGKVRAALTEEQRKKLQELIGDQFVP